MSNIADCAMAIAKADISKLDGAIKRTNKKDGYSYRYEWNATDKEGRKNHITETNDTSYDGEKNEHYFIVEGGAERKTAVVSEVYHKEWQPNLITDHDSFSRTKESDISNGYEVDWVKLGSYPYQGNADVREYDDHITVYFPGRWSFPVEVEDFMNEHDVRWQGALAEPGCEAYDDTLGNEDFGLRVVVCGEEQDWGAVEDITDVPEDQYELWEED